MDYLVLDTETTGLNSGRYHTTLPCSITDNGDEVIQIGGLILNGKLEPVRGFCHYADALLPESGEQALNVHGISLREIRKSLPNVFIEEVVAQNLPQLYSSDVTVIGYNCAFDIRMLMQGLRNFSESFRAFQFTSTALPSKGRWAVDVMKYMPRRRKLVSYSEQLTPARERFYREYGDSLVIDSNCQHLLHESFNHAHNALYDVIETYLLFTEEVLGKRLFREGGTSGR